MAINPIRFVFPVLVVALCPVANADPWRVVDLGVRNLSQAWGINAGGEISGSYNSGGQKGFVRSRDGTLTDIGTLGRRTVARKINARGWVVGWSEPPSESAVAMVWRPESGIESIGRLPGDSGVSDATSINTAGQVAGWSCCLAGARAFVWSAAKGMRDLGSLHPNDEEGTFAYDINDRGFIVGQSGVPPANPEIPSANWHAFLWSPRGRMIDLGTLGGHFSAALGINNRNEVVGVSEIADGHLHAFLWSKGEMTDLGTLGGQDSSAGAINDHGQIVGESSLASGGSSHAFVWSARDGMVDLGTLTGIGESRANDINDRGAIVGVSFDGTSEETAVMWVRDKRHR